MENLINEIQKLLGAPLTELYLEFEEYFEMIKKILDYDIKRILNLPRSRILKKFSLTEEKLREPLYLPEILLLTEFIKENNFNYFQRNWNTYGYYHYDHGYKLKEILEELRPFAEDIKQYRKMRMIKILDKASKEKLEITAKPRIQLIEENFEQFRLPEFKDFKDLINKAAGHPDFYRILPILFRCLFENILYYIFRDGLSNSHREFSFLKAKNRPRDFSELIVLLNILKNELKPYCRETISPKLIEILDEIREFGNRNVHEILDVIDEEFPKKWKKKISLVLKPLIVLYKNVKDEKIEIKDDYVLRKIKKELNIRKDKFEKKKKVSDEITLHFKELFKFLEKLFLDKQVNIDDIRFIIGYIENNKKDFMTYLKFEREPTAATSVQNFYLLRGKYRIHFGFNIKPRIKISEEKTIEWIDSDNDPEKSYEVFKKIRQEMINHLETEFRIHFE